MDIQEQCAKSYEQHKHLKTVGDELGIPWQTVYVNLKRMGIPVTGDKMAHGSPKDKLAATGELMFGSYVRCARNLNAESFQPKIDFDVRGYGVDVKTAIRCPSDKKFKSARWAFSLKKQVLEADFFVLMALGENKNLEKCFLIPAELVRNLQTISIPVSMKSKWAGFLIETNPNHLGGFFKSLPEPPKEQQ